MANNRPSIIVNEDDKCINLIAKDGFSQNASFLDKIRETLETDSYKQINLFLAPSADSDLSNALFSIRLKAITSELKKVDIATHDHSIFRQRISGSVRKINTPMYKIESSPERAEITILPSKRKMFAYDNEMREICNILACDKPKEVKICLCAAAKEHWQEATPRLESLQNAFHQSLMENYCIEKLSFTRKAHKEKQLMKKYRRVELSLQEVAFEPVSKAHDEKKISEKNLPAFNAPLQPEDLARLRTHYSKYQVKQIVKRTQERCL